MLLVYCYLAPADTYIHLPTSSNTTYCMIEMEEEPEFLAFDDEKRFQKMVCSACQWGTYTYGVACRFKAMPKPLPSWSHPLDFWVSAWVTTDSGVHGYIKREEGS